MASLLVAALAKASWLLIRREHVTAARFNITGELEAANPDAACRHPPGVRPI